MLKLFRPEVVVLPHPELDPHPDHIQASRALDEAIALGDWCPELRLLYANHLYDNDRWPMGPVGSGVALPPRQEPLPADDPLWRHPQVVITPHMASAAPAEVIARQLLENIQRQRRGLPLKNLVNKHAGY